jgi:nicotinamidase-related amidase
MKLDPKKTAVLSLDVQNGIFGFVPGAEAMIPHGALVMETARKGGFTVMHVGIGFEPGYPEISPTNKRFAMMKEKNIFVKGTDSSKTHPAILKPGEWVIFKHRVSAFAGNSLQMILRAQGIENLVLFGIATSGIVLSTIRAAADLDFQVTVIKDACYDRDEEVHRVLTEKVFANQGTVLTAKEFQAENAG